MTSPWREQIPFMRECTFTESPHRLCGATNDRVGAPHMLFFHGVSRYWRTFYTLFPALNDHFRLTALDFRGHGKSERSSGRYIVTDYVEDALTLLKTLDVRDGILYGHSLGAMVALATAAHAPQRVARIILEDPPFSTMGEQLPNTPLGVYFRGMHAVARSSRDASELYKNFSALEVNGRPLRESRTEDSLRFSAEGFSLLDPTVLDPVNEGRWLRGFHWRDLLPRVQCPVLVFQADPASGGMLSDSEADVLAGAIRDCEIVRVEGAPHLVHWQRPEIIAKHIRSLD